VRPVPVIVVLTETNTVRCAVYIFSGQFSPSAVLGLHPPTDPTLVILALFVTIFAALVTRSVRRRRQRNASFLAALASGTYGPPRGNQDWVPESKPVLWEARITSVYDEGKGLAGLSVRHFPNRSHAYYYPYAEGVGRHQPVAGVTSVPAHEAKSQQPASRQPRLRFPNPGTRPAAPNLPPTTPPLESLASSSNPIYMTVLVSMPSPRAHERARQGNAGPPVVELGVAEVTCTQNVA
jgi:hypothetical protein